MTILAQYTPTKIALPSATAEFTFEHAGPDTIEVWMETATDDPSVYIRELIPQSRYTLNSYNAYNSISPLFLGGAFTFPSDLIPDTATRLSIERNTPIKQLCDFRLAANFHLDLIEFSLDKLTMLIQEIASRKCRVSLATVTQEIFFNRQKTFIASNVNFALDKLIDYCQQMVTNGDDCSNDLENT